MKKPEKKLDGINTSQEPCMIHNIEGSSRIKRMAYDPNNGYMDVEFHKGKSIYRYPGVMRIAYEAIATSGSVGTTFQAFLNTYKGQYEKLSKWEWE